ncbi:MAG: radical SAM protein [Thermodesulfobacteriota bacterium]
MRVRYESFGGIVAVDDPPATVWVDHAYMRELGYRASPLWKTDRTHLSAPVTVHFAITGRCRLGCGICSMSSTPGMDAELSTAQAKQVLDTLSRMSVFTVAFGGGEPLYRPDVFELAAYAKTLGIVPTMTTNGMEMDRDKARLCRVFDHVHVSLDGVGETYSAVRGVDGFDGAASAIRMLMLEGVSVGINTVVCRANFDGLEELARFLTGLGVRDVIFLRLKPVGRAASQYHAMKLSRSQRLSLYERISELTLRYGLHAHVDCSMMPFIYYHGPEDKWLRLFGGDGCVAANEILEIDPTGTMRACSFAPESAGNTLDLPQVWDNAPEFHAFRESTATSVEPCSSCRYVGLCRGGCRAVAACLTGDPHAPDPECLFVGD